MKELKTLVPGVLPLIGPTDLDTPHWSCVSAGHRNGPNPPFDYLSLFGMHCRVSKPRQVSMSMREGWLHPMLSLRTSIRGISPSQSQTARLPSYPLSLTLLNQTWKSILLKQPPNPLYLSPSTQSTPLHTLLPVAAHLPSCIPSHLYESENEDVMCLYAVKYVSI